jgi:hypothetical protein
VLLILHFQPFRTFAPGIAALAFALKRKLIAKRSRVDLSPSIRFARNARGALCLRQCVVENQSHTLVPERISHASFSDLMARINSNCCTQ